MAFVRVTVSEVIEIPEGAEVDYSPIGAVCGIRMADGRVVKPWITYEIEEDGQAADLTHDELQALGFDPGGDIERTIDEVDGAQGDVN